MASLITPRTDVEWPLTGARTRPRLGAVVPASSLPGATLLGM